MNCLPPHFEMGTKADVSFQGKKKLLKYLVSSTQMRTTELFSSRTSYSYYLLEESTASDTVLELEQP